MLFSDKLLFIHAPKTAGTSVTKLLLDNIQDHITLVIPSDRPDPAVSVPLMVRAKANLKATLTDLKFRMFRNVTIAEGRRHEPLSDAARSLSRFGRRVEDFDTIVSIMRNPYDLEVSRYHFLRRGYLGVAGLARERAQRIALDGDFTRFACMAPYHGRMPSRIEDWYQVDGAMPQNLHIVRFETLEEDIGRILGRLYPIQSGLPKLNASTHAPYRSYMNAEAESGIYRKFRWLFDREFYKREQFPALAPIHSAENREHV
jgi:sulfotransferase family protein